MNVAGVFGAVLYLAVYFAIITCLVKQYSPSNESDSEGAFDENEIQE